MNLILLDTSTVFEQNENAACFLVYYIHTAKYIKVKTWTLWSDLKRDSKMVWGNTFMLCSILQNIKLFSYFLFKTCTVCLSESLHLPSCTAETNAFYTLLAMFGGTLWAGKVWKGNCVLQSHTTHIYIWMDADFWNKLHVYYCQATTANAKPNTKLF